MRRPIVIRSGRLSRVRASINLDCLKWAEWDKVKPWRDDLEVILHLLKHPESYMFEVTLYCAPQLMKWLEHWSVIRCFTFFNTVNGYFFFTHNSSGITHYANFFDLTPSQKVCQSKSLRFHIPWAMEKVTFYGPSQVYFSFSNDGLLRVSYFCDNQAFETSTFHSRRSVLCFEYIPDTKEIVAGCIGSVESYYIVGLQHEATIHKGRQFNVSLTKYDWAFDLKVDVMTHTLLILIEKAVFGVDYKKNTVTFEIKNLYLTKSSFRSCCFYNHGEYVLTGSGDGCIKVWNPTLATVVHEFLGHRAGVTALRCHDKEPLAFSSSLDGLVQIWRIDNFQRFMKLEIGDSILSMSLIGDEIMCQTKHDIKFYHLAYFYKIFAYTEATVVRLVFYQGKKYGKQNRVFCYSEDCCYRLFSVVSGESLIAFYPMAYIQTFTEFCYNMRDELVYAVLLDGSVLIMQTIVNPSTAIHTLRPKNYKELVKKLCIFDVECDCVEDTIVLAGLSHGQIILIDAKRSEFAGLKEHEGAITCLESLDELDGGALGLPPTDRFVASGAEDLQLKLWRVTVRVQERGTERGTERDTEQGADEGKERSLVLTLLPLTTFTCTGIPNCVCVSSDMIAFSYAMSEYLNLYKIVRVHRHRKTFFRLEDVFHSVEREHTDAITAICACPAVAIFATCSDDGMVKIWDYNGDMIKELNFGHRVSGLCFCSTRGDLLVGFYCYVIIVNIVNYLPVEQFKIIAQMEFEDDEKEKPVFDDFTLDPRSDIVLMVPQPLELRLQRKTVNEVYRNWLASRVVTRRVMFGQRDLKGFVNTFLLDKAMKEQYASGTMIFLRAQLAEGLITQDPDWIMKQYETGTTTCLKQHLQQITIPGAGKSQKMITFESVRTLKDEVSMIRPESRMARTESARTLKDDLSLGRLDSSVRLTKAESELERKSLLRVDTGQNLDQQQQEVGEQTKRRKKFVKDYDRQLDEVRRGRDSLITRIDGIREERDCLKDDIIRFKKKFDLLEEKIGALQRQKDALPEDDVEQITPINIEIAGLEKEKHMLVGDIYMYRKKKVVLERNIEDLRKERDSVYIDIEELEQLTRAEHSIGSLKARKDTIDHQIDVLKHKTSLLGDLSDLEKKCDLLEGTIRLLEKKNTESTEKVLDNLNKQRDALKTTIDGLKNLDVMQEDEISMSRKKSLGSSIEVLKRRRNSIMDLIKKKGELSSSHLLVWKGSRNRLDKKDSNLGELAEDSECSGPRGRGDSLTEVLSKVEVAMFHHRLSSLVLGEKDEDVVKCLLDEYLTDGRCDDHHDDDLAQEAAQVPLVDYELSPWEETLLDKRPIIAPDGFVPNSIVRDRIFWKPPVERPVSDLDRWEPLPVPDPWPEWTGSQESVWFVDDEEEEQAMSPSVGGSEVFEVEGFDLERTSSARLRSSYEMKKRMKDEWDYDQRFRGKTTNIADWRKEKFKKPRKPSSVEPPRQSEPTKPSPPGPADSEHVMSLIQRVCAEMWFPESQDPTIATYLSLHDLLTLLLSRDSHQNIWDCIVRIHKVRGIVKRVKDKFLGVLQKKLKMADAKLTVATLQNIRALADSNCDHIDELVREILPYINHSDKQVCTEAINTVSKLKGLKNKDDLIQLLQESGALEEKTHRDDEKNALKIMEDNLRMRLKEKIRSTAEEMSRSTEEEKLRLAEEEKLRLAEEDKSKLTEEEESKLSEEKKRTETLRLAKEKKLRLSKDKKFPLSEEEKLRLGEDERLRRIEEANLHLREERELPVNEEEKVPLSEDEKLPLSEDEKLRLSEEEKVPLSEDEKLRLSEDEKLRLSEDKKLRLSEDEKLPLSEDKKLRLSEEEEKVPLSEEEKLRLSEEEEKVPLSEDEKVPLSEDEKLHVSEEEKVPLSEEKELGMLEEEKPCMSDEEKSQLSEEERLRRIEDEKLRLSEEERLRRIEEEKLRLSEEQRLRLSEEKLSLSEEEKLRLSEEEMLRLSEEKLTLSEEEKLHLSEEKLTLSEEEKLHLSEEKLTLSEEEKLRLSEEEKLRLSEEEKLRLSEEEKLRLSEEEKLRLSEEEKLRLSEEERLRRIEEEKLRLIEQERLRRFEEEMLLLSEEERLRRVEEEKIRLNEELCRFSEAGWFSLSEDESLSEEGRLRKEQTLRGDLLRLKLEDKISLMRGEGLDLSQIDGLGLESETKMSARSLDKKSSQKVEDDFTKGALVISPITPRQSRIMLFPQLVVAPAEEEKLMVRPMEGLEVGHRHDAVSPEEQLVVSPEERLVVTPEESSDISLAEPKLTVTPVEDDELKASSDSHLEREKKKRHRRKSVKSTDVSRLNPETLAITRRIHKMKEAERLKSKPEHPKIHRHDVGDDGTDKHSPTRREKSGRVSKMGPVSPTTSPGRRKVHFVDDSVGRFPPCIDVSPGDVTPHPPLVVDIHYRDKQKQATPIPTTTVTATPVTAPPVPTTGLVESHTADTEISLTTSSVKELANFMGRYLDAHFPKKRPTKKGIAPLGEFSARENWRDFLNTATASERRQLYKMFNHLKKRGITSLTLPTIPESTDQHDKLLEKPESERSKLYRLRRGLELGTSKDTPLIKIRRKQHSPSRKPKASLDHQRVRYLPLIESVPRGLLEQTSAGMEQDGWADFTLTMRGREFFPDKTSREYGDVFDVLSVQTDEKQHEMGDRMSKKSKHDFSGPPSKQEADTAKKPYKGRSLPSMVAAHLPKVRPGGQIFQWKFPLPPPPEHFSISDAVDSPAHEAYHHYFKHTHLSEEKTRHYLSKCRNRSELLKVVETKEYHRYTHYFSKSTPQEGKRDKDQVSQSLGLQDVVKKLFSRS